MVEKKPTRRTEIISVLGREVMVYEPADTQLAVLARLSKSTRIDPATKVSQLIDLLDSWFVVESDREWFGDGLLGGEWDLEKDVMPLVATITDAFSEEATNRAARRAPAKAAPTKRAARKAI